MPWPRADARGSGGGGGSCSASTGEEQGGRSESGLAGAAKARRMRGRAPGWCRGAGRCAGRPSKASGSCTLSPRREARGSRQEGGGLADRRGSERGLPGAPSVQNSIVESSVSFTGRKVVWKRIDTSLSRSSEERSHSDGSPTYPPYVPVGERTCRFYVTVGAHGNSPAKRLRGGTRAGDDHAPACLRNLCSVMGCNSTRSPGLWFPVGPREKISLRCHFYVSFTRAARPRSCQKLPVHTADDY